MSEMERMLHNSRTDSCSDDEDSFECAKHDDIPEFDDDEVRASANK